MPTGDSSKCEIDSGSAGRFAWLAEQSGCSECGRPPDSFDKSANTHKYLASSLTPLLRARNASGLMTTCFACEATRQHKRSAKANGVSSRWQQLTGTLAYIRDISTSSPHRRSQSAYHNIHDVVVAGRTKSQYARNFSLLLPSRRISYAASGKVRLLGLLSVLAKLEHNINSRSRCTHLS